METGPDKARREWEETHIPWWERPGEGGSQRTSVPMWETEEERRMRMDRIYWALFNSTTN